MFHGTIENVLSGLFSQCIVGIFSPSSAAVRALQQMQYKATCTIDPVLSPCALKRSHRNRHVHHNCASAMGPLLAFYAASATSAITVPVCRAGPQNGSHGPELGLAQEGTDSTSDSSLLIGPEILFGLLTVHIQN